MGKEKGRPVRPAKALKEPQVPSDICLCEVSSVAE